MFQFPAPNPTGFRFSRNGEGFGALNTEQEKTWKHEEIRKLFSSKCKERKEIGRTYKLKELKFNQLMNEVVYQHSAAENKGTFSWFSLEYEQAEWE